MDAAPLDLLIGADDRTGALEAAGAAAAALGRQVSVHVRTASGNDPGTPRGLAGPVVTVDLGSRHLTADAARERALGLDRIPSRRHLHKIDSTLRGRWADELLARSASGQRPVLIVPALPALGRVCVDGVVQIDGRPVDEGSAGRDVVAPPASSRPDALLRLAGADEILGLPDVAAVVEWSERPHGIAIADARTDAELAAHVAAWWERPDVLLAGTSAVALAASTLLSARHPGRGAPGTTAVVSEQATTPPRVSPGRVLLVVGSAHPMALVQTERLVQRGCRWITPDDRITGPVGARLPVLIAATDRPSGPIPAESAARHARRLADAAARSCEELDPEVIVVIGGDTAAAVLGDGPVQVGGVLAPGTPWARQSGTGRLMVTRAGGFGGPDALVELVWGTLVG